MEGIVVSLRSTVARYEASFAFLLGLAREFRYYRSLGLLQAARGYLVVVDVEVCLHDLEELRVSFGYLYLEVAWHGLIKLGLLESQGSTHGCTTIHFGLKGVRLRFNE